MRVVVVDPTAGLTVLHGSIKRILDCSNLFLDDLQFSPVVLHSALIRPCLIGAQGIPCFLVFAGKIVEILLVQGLLGELLLVIVLEAV